MKDTAVAPVPPGEISIGRQALTVLRRVMAAAAPEEGCALLLGEASGRGQGEGDPAGWRLLRVWPCRNVWAPAPERRRRFAIDPREQLQAQRWARPRGLRVLGSAHSHPTGPPVPSATDRALAYVPALLLILGALPEGSSAPFLAGDFAGGGGFLGCWWLGEAAGASAPPPRKVAWRMEC